MFPDLTRDDVFRLETARLWLRWPRQADVQAIVELAGDKEVAEMTGVIPHPYPPAEADAFVLRTRTENANGTALTMAITLKRRPNDLVGIVGIKGPSEANPVPFIGYWMGRPHWGRGLATEAARAMIDAAFAYTPADELAASARVVNPASRRVLEKCGFASQGSGLQSFPVRGGALPVDYFRLDRRTWASLKSWGLSGPTAHGRETSGEAALPLAAE
ncbi:GNAT family N-acetyltransferase [Salinarimonas soli]|uniref:GNAT family N-acetyltransferase n=1 Tax=Salinarimonas soli TaxID=1638099 RepID=A0A5B2VBG4_9HYPH|nr:GNAT family N-acetyltransferase [Salinarimonas soli]KAA2236411.1 GNAT family N-acetyltransferase [Salinarimonas soli]